MKHSVLRSALAWILLLCMLVGLLPVSAVATPGEEEDKPETKAATNYVSRINALATPHNVAYNETTTNLNYIGSGGYYYIVNKASSTKGHLLAMNEKFTYRYYHATDVTISGSTLVNPNPDSAVQFSVPQANRISMRPVKGITTKVAGLVDETFVSIYRNDPGVFGGRTSNGKWVFLSFMGNISYAKDSWFSMQYVTSRVSTDEFYGEDGFSIIYHEGHEEKYIDTELMQLYRVYTQGSELYKAIKAMVGYADGNGDGRYPADLYGEFSAYLGTCISTYTDNNNVVTAQEEATLKTTMDAMAETLLSYRDRLTKNDSSQSFIDIPVEVLDFRADGMVFEWEGSNTGYYSLWSAPGNTVEAPLTPGQNVRKGLTEEYLVGGQIVYKESTIKTVAQGLQKKYGYDWGADGDIPGWNSAFYTRMNKLTDLGTFAATIAKTDTKANGGYLKWNQVETCYDMAYYMLSNFWRAVEDEDYLDTVNKLGYNTVINERKRLRLYLDEETGRYTMDASNAVCYDGYYTFNAEPTVPTTRLAQDAYFTPVDGLGFESPTYKALLGDTDKGRVLAQYQHELADTNYHYSLHAKGSFVYYHDQNLYFQFIGDDDVYFYINGRRVMDLGADHPPAGDEVYLNAIAETYGLKEGGVYSFDMFFIERHTARANLKFATNINIVETETMTTKGMYLENSKGISKVNSTTGMGEELAENALLRDGDLVAYSFNIANSRKVPVYNLSFTDASMGVSLSSAGITLCNTSLTGGISTHISDIKVYYRTLEEDGSYYAGNPIQKTVAEMSGLIDSANGLKKGLNTGNYMVAPGTTANLISLLQKGIPAECQILIYGFKRQALESVPTYQNIVNSLCYYNLSGTAQTTVGAEEIPVSGSATRTYQVSAEPPTAQKQQMVLDYGKAVEIPVETIGKNIQTDALTTVTGFAGILTSGSHEQVLTNIYSADLLCASAGGTYAGIQGTFTRTETGLDYQPTKFMDTIETVYLAYRISATNSDYKYVLVELKLLPATSVYYETDFADQAVNTLSGSDLFDHSDCFYVDFNNGESDGERYKNANYGNKNYDKSNWNLRSYTMSGLKYDSTLGVLSANRPIDKDQSLTLHYFRALNLDYDPTNAEVFVARVKLEGMQRVSNTKIKIYVIFFNVNNDSTIKTYTVYQDSDDLVSGKFVDIEIPVSDLGSYGKLVREIRLNIDNIQLADPDVAGKISLDYMYVGPKKNAPAQDHLYFDFTDSGSDRNRYSTHNYKGRNFDTEQKWAATWLDSGVYSTAQIDQNVGTLVTTADKDSCYVETALKPGSYKGEVLSYDPSHAEIMKIRFKLSNTAATAPKIQLAYGISGNTGTVKYESTKQAFEYTNGMFTTVTVPLSNTFRNAGTIAYIRPQFLNVGIGTEVTIDYIYVGSQEGAPAGEYLYFDFTNTPADKARYANDPAYGGYNFDDDAYWTGKWDANGNHADAIVDNVAGTMTSSYPGSSEVYFYTTYSGKYGTKTLKFNPKTAEVWEVRFKLNAALSGSANVRLNYAADGSADILYTENKPTFTYTVANQYITKTERLTSTFTGKSQILSLRLAFNGIPAGTEVTVDYIFVGTEADLEKVRAESNSNWQTVENATVTTDDYQDENLIQVNTDEKLTSVPETFGAAPAVLSENYGIRNGLNNYKNNVPLSFSHRGSSRTSSENSYIAILNSLKQGMDGVEIDLAVTTDNVVVLSHDDSLKRTTGKDVKVSASAWSAIKDYPLEVVYGSGDTQLYTLTADEAALLNTLSNYKTHYGEAAEAGKNHYLARLDDVLELIKENAPNALITLDKVGNEQKYFVYSYKTIYDFNKANSCNMFPNIFFKLNSNVDVKTWATAAATACGITQAEVLSNMQMLWVIGVPNATRLNQLKTYLNNGIKVMAVEGSWETVLSAANEKYIADTFVPYCKSVSVDFWPTVIDHKWAGKLDDDESTWAYYLEKMDADGLMTDRPEEFGAFMHYYGGASRATSELIQAEHFQSYNLDSAKFYMNEAADLNNNKLVNKMQNGDYLEYRNITFTGSENTLYVTAKGIGGGGTLRFYADAISDENLFASISFGSSQYCVTRTVTLCNKVSAGSHKIFVQVVGKGGTPLVSFDSFTFAKQSDDHYLFFDFTNTEADRERYAKSVYGSNYNFDTKENWATYTDAKKHTIDNTQGVAVINLTSSDSNTHFTTAKTYGTYPRESTQVPLKYKPSASDYLVVRFKLDGVVDSGDNTITIDICRILSGAHNRIYNTGIKAEYTFVTGVYQTIVAKMPAEFTDVEWITSLGLQINGIKPGSSGSGTITYDYIYVGPLQQADHMLFDYQEDMESYNDPVYGGRNFDLSSNWAYSVPGRNTAPAVANGNISTTTSGSSDRNYYHIKMASADLNYIPGDDDYCEIRFKVSNATSDGSANIQMFLYFSPDIYGTKGTGQDNGSSITIPVSDLTDGEYHTRSFPIDISYYRDAGVIRSIALMFHKFSQSAVMTFDVDYVYVGPKDQAPSASKNSLFFDFTNTAADRERYSSNTYGGYNFDREGTGGYWSTYTTDNGHVNDQKNYVIDNAEGVAIINVGEANEGTSTTYGPKFQTTNRYGYYPWNNFDRHAYAPLHYKPTGEEYIQVRFKIEGCQKVATTKFQLDYHLDPPFITTEKDGSPKTNYIEYYGLNKTFTYTDGEWITLTYSLAGVTRFQNAAEIQSVGLRFVGIKGKDANTLGRVVIDYIYIGPEDGLPTADNDTYGYDSSYVDDSRLSDESSLYVHGRGIPNIAKDKDGNPAYIDYTSVDAYTEMSFTFVGTGFDLISRTGVNQGMIRAVIFDSSGTIVKDISVINKGETELYQIPVLSVEKLAYGKYTVKIFVNKAYDYGNNGNADIFGGALDRGGEFYFDAIRIYNPINTQATDAVSTCAYEIYQKHGEADPVITEVRNILIGANSFTSGASSVNGVVYLDATAMSGTEFDNENGKLKPEIAEYKAIGPNNEVYLLPGKAIAFKLEVSGPIPASIDIGAKSANGENVIMSVGISKDVPTALTANFSQVIQTSTAQYYPLEIVPSKLKTTTANGVDTHSVYITVYHSGTTGILSLTDIKYAYDHPNPDKSGRERMVHFMVDTQMLAMYTTSCDHVWDQGEITTVPTCVSEGEKTFTCSLCGAIYTETVSTTDHSYVDGLCACGQEETTVLLKETSWKIGHTLNLASDISVNLVVSKSLLEGYDMDTVCVMATVDVYEGNCQTDAETVKLLPVEQGNYYYFTLTGLTAVSMNDRIHSVLYGTKDGQMYYSATDDYSIADYAYSQLDKGEAPIALKNLCAQLLCYGAKAQIYKGYRTDALADRDLTGERSKYLRELSDVEFGNTNEILGDLTAPAITWVGKTLSLESKVILKYVFSTEAYAGDVTDLSLCVSYRDVDGEILTATVTQVEVYNAERKQYAFSFDGLLAAELRTVLSAQIYAGDEPVSATMVYSPDTYGVGKTGTLGELCKALFAYSDSAREYFEG